VAFGSGVGSNRDSLVKKVDYGTNQDLTNTYPTALFPVGDLVGSRVECFAPKDKFERLVRGSAGTAHTTSTSGRIDGVTGSFDAPFYNKVGIPRAIKKMTTASGFRSEHFNGGMPGEQHHVNMSALHTSLTTGNDGHIVNTALTGRKRPLNLVHKKGGTKPPNAEGS